MVAVEDVVEGLVEGVEGADDTFNLRKLLTLSLYIARHYLFKVFHQ